MLESPAYRALSFSGRRVLDVIEIELAQHAGKDNGKLPVTFRDFVAYGLHWNGIAPAIRETVSLGFVKVTRPGRAGNGASRIPNLFRLTYRHSDREEPTHDWRRITTMEQARKLAGRTRPKKQNTAHGKRISPDTDSVSHAAHGKRITVRDTESVSLSISRGGDLPGGRLSAEPAGRVRTTVVGRGRAAVEVVRDDDRCYGFLRRRGSSYEAWWSGNKFDDHLIGEFASVEAAIAAVVEAAVRSNGSAAPGGR
jgi:hypothetical protein